MQDKLASHDAKPELVPDFKVMVELLRARDTGTGTVILQYQNRRWFSNTSRGAKKVQNNEQHTSFLAPVLVQTFFMWCVTATFFITSVVLVFSASFGLHRSLARELENFSLLHICTALQEKVTYVGKWNFAEERKIVATSKKSNFRFWWIHVLDMVENPVH